MSSTGGQRQDTVIRTGQVLDPSGEQGATADAPEVGPGWVHIVDGLVAAVGTGRPPRDPDHELPEGLLVPGLVDAQINGAYGVDFAEADVEEMARVAAALPATGVTAFVPTFITATIEELCDQLRRYRVVRAELAARPGLARLLPAHVEGPFLAETRRGAHRADRLCDPTPERVEALLDAGGADLGYLTLAPEREGAPAAIARCVAAGVRVAVGHSDASADVVHAAADHGASLVTHLYNAQSPLHHRDPGVVGAALTDHRLTLGLIVDLHHVAADAVKVAFAAAPDRVMLVTDAVAAAGMPPGSYRLAGVDLHVVEGQPPRRDDGVLAGSAARLDASVAAAHSVGVPLAVAVRAATVVPARALGLLGAGTLQVGSPADLTVLDRTTFRALATWVGGHRAS